MVQVNRDEFEEAMEAALEGPQLKGYRVIGHGFNVKPIERSAASGGRVHIKGQLSHRLKWRDDDQVHYQMTVDVGERVSIDDVDINIDRSFLDDLIDKATDWLVEWIKEKLEEWLKERVPLPGGFTGGEVGSAAQMLAAHPEEARDRIFEESKELLEGGGWKDAANFIIVNVVGRAAVGQALLLVRPQVRDHRTGDEAVVDTDLFDRADEFVQPAKLQHTTRVRDHRLARDPD